MKKFKVTVAFECQAEHSIGAVSCIQESIKRAGFVNYKMLNAEEVRTPLDDYMDAKAAFYAADEGKSYKPAQEYLDAAIKALHARQLDTVQLLSVWQDVKPYL